MMVAMVRMMMVEGDEDMVTRCGTRIASIPSSHGIRVVSI